MSFVLVGHEQQSWSPCGIVPRVDRPRDVGRKCNGRRATVTVKAILARRHDSQCVCWQALTRQGCVGRVGCDASARMTQRRQLRRQCWRQGTTLERVHVHCQLHVTIVRGHTHLIQLKTWVRSQKAEDRFRRSVLGCQSLYPASRGSCDSGVSTASERRKNHRHYLLVFDEAVRFKDTHAALASPLAALAHRTAAVASHLPVPTRSACQRYPTTLATRLPARRDGGRRGLHVLHCGRAWVTSFI